LKFGALMQRHNISKTHKEKSRKGRGLGHVTHINFGVHPNLSPKRVELEIGIWYTEAQPQYLKNRKEKSRKGAWPRSRDPHNFWRTP